MDQHEHEFLGTYLRKYQDKWFVVFSGERDTDTYAKYCDCGAYLKDDGTIGIFDEDFK